MGTYTQSWAMFIHFPDWNHQPHLFCGPSSAESSSLKYANIFSQCSGRYSVSIPQKPSIFTEKINPWTSNLLHLHQNLHENPREFMECSPHKKKKCHSPFKTFKPPYLCSATAATAATDPQASPTMGAGTMYSQADLGIRLATRLGKRWP